MTDQAQVESDALLARRLQEEEFVLANWNNMFDSGQIPPSPSRTSGPSEQNATTLPQSSASTEQNVTSRSSRLTDTPPLQPNTGPDVNRMFQSLLEEMRGPGTFDSYPGLRDNIFRGLDDFLPAQNDVNPEPLPTQTEQHGPASFEAMPTPFSFMGSLSNMLHRHIGGALNNSFGVRARSEGGREPGNDSSSGNTVNVTMEIEGHGPDGVTISQETGMPEQMQHNNADAPPGVGAANLVDTMLQQAFGGGGIGQGVSETRNGDGNGNGNGVFFEVGQMPMQGGPGIAMGFQMGGPGVAAMAARGFRSDRGDESATFNNLGDLLTWVESNPFDGQVPQEILHMVRDSIVTSMSPTAESYEDFVNLVERLGSVNRSATEAEIDALPTHLYKQPGEVGEKNVPCMAGPSSSSAPSEETEAGEQVAVDKCAICLGDYDVDEEVKHMPCGHMFHSECLGRWLKINRTCPICKQSLRQGDGPTE